MANDIALSIFNDELTEELQKRLARCEGQIRGVAAMVGNQRGCLEVLQQLASVQSALRGVTKSVLQNYLNTCVANAIHSGDDDFYDELIESIFKFAK